VFYCYCTNGFLLLIWKFGYNFLNLSFKLNGCSVNVLVTAFKETILAECSSMIKLDKTQSMITTFNTKNLQCYMWSLSKINIFNNSIAYDITDNWSSLQWNCTYAKIFRKSHYSRPPKPPPYNAVLNQRAVVLGIRWDEIQQEDDHLFYSHADH
jgi:hypothetical protein